MLSTESKDFIREHYSKIFGVDPEDFMVLPNEPVGEAQVDIIWFKPTTEFNFNVLATCGLSDLQMDEPPQAIELIMLLPPDWKVGDKKDEWWWPLELLTQAAYLPFATGESLSLGSVISLTENDEPFMKGTKNCGLIITLPEYFSPAAFEVQLDEGSYLRFFQCVPVNKDDIERINESSPFKFIEFNLHNADGPDFVVKKR